MKSHMWWVADRSTNPISAPGGKGSSLPAALLLSSLNPRRASLAACQRNRRTGNRPSNPHNQFDACGSFCLLLLTGVPFHLPALTSRHFQIAIVGLAGGLLLLAVIAWLRRRAMLKDYQEIADDVRVISKSLKGKIYRKRDDLRLKGRYHRWPVFIKFSNSLQAPGLHIRIPVPTQLTLFLIPRKLQEKNSLGKTVVPTSDPMFDSRFATRSDQPVQARMLISSESVQNHLQRLCCSPSTCVSMTSGKLELTEPLIPEADLEDHVLNHVKSMVKIGAEALKMPGADRSLIKAGDAKPHRLVWITVTIAILVLVGLFFVNRAIQPQTAKAVLVPAGILPGDAGLITGVDHWRLAEAQDFDPRGVTWLQSKGKEVTGHLFGRFAGEGFAEESAYVLVSDDRRQPSQVRIILIIGQTVRFDKVYPSIAVMTRVQKTNLETIPWQGTPPFAPSDGDGLLIVSNYDDPKSASIIYIYKKHVLTSGTPVDFHAIPMS